MNNIIKNIILLLGLVPIAAHADRNNEPAVFSQQASRSFLTDAETLNDLTVLVGERGHILYRQAGTEGWQQAVVPVRVDLTSISLTANDGYWAVGHDSTILKASSPGHWVLAKDGPYLAEVAAKDLQQRLDETSSSTEPDSEFIAFLEYARDELEFSLKDGGGNSLFDIHMTESGTGMIVGASGWAFLTRDHGEHWHYITPDLPNPDLLHLYTATSTSEDDLFIAGEGGLIFHSGDGNQWESVSIPYDGTILSAHASGRPGELYLLGMGGKLLHSTDNGQNWKLLQLPSKTVLQGACTTPNGALLVTGLGGQAFHVRNNQITQIPFPGRQHLAAPVCAADHYQVVGEGGVYPLAMPPETDDR